MQYDHQSIEKKWQDRWERDHACAAPEQHHKVPAEQKYILDMFPYPSSQGLHVGHPEGYTATDIVARFSRMKGYRVLHPMGWDAFGLPAENYAIKVGIHPVETTQKSIDTFKRQIKSLGFSYDWGREVNTSDPSYYRWTQWFFLLLYKHGWAYRKNAPVNWCESCQTVLAREQVVEGRCERCKNTVMQKNLEQWFFKITDFIEDRATKGDKGARATQGLMTGLGAIDWPEPIKLMQRNWIGKSTGINITYQVENISDSITVFTTRPDTNFGATFVVLAPEHEFISRHLNEFPHKEKVVEYRAMAQKKTELERISEGKKKTGVFTGWHVINNLNQKKLPICVGDFVLAQVGTGAVVGVPGHDGRDFEFAKTLGIEVARVVVGPDGDTGPIERIEQVQEDQGVMVNSDFLNGLDIHEATKRVMDYLEEKGWGKRVVVYKLRDWLISRQRYWGAPIPIIYCNPPGGGCGEVPVPEKDLPVLLPDDVDFRPTGESPLARSKKFHDVACPRCGARGEGVRRECDTMDTFVDSSWYFFRYTDPHNKEEFAAREKIHSWLPVDLYVGGAEHAVLHLMYARFFTKVLHVLGMVDFDEPFLSLKNQGMILGEDGQKMSKSRGNVINPDDVIGVYGADTMRLYEMFMGPLEDAKPWSTRSIVGVRRFLERVWVFVEDRHLSIEEGDEGELNRSLHKTIKKVTEDIEAFKFNTAISALMAFLNSFINNRISDSGKEQSIIESFLKLLQPFAPHIAEELWDRLGHTTLLMYEPWPGYDPKYLKEEEMVIVVQVDGKKRGTVICPVQAREKEVMDMIRQDQGVSKYLEAKEIVKTVYVPGKLLNIVTRD